IHEQALVVRGHEIARRELGIELALRGRLAKARGLDAVGRAQDAEVVLEGGAYRGHEVERRGSGAWTDRVLETLGLFASGGRHRATGFVLDRRWGRKLLGGRRPGPERGEEPQRDPRQSRRPPPGPVVSHPHAASE